VRDQQYLQELGYDFACVVLRVMVEFDTDQQRKGGLRGTFEKRGAFGDTIKKLGLVGLACSLERMRFGLVCFWGANCRRALFVLCCVACGGEKRSIVHHGSLAVMHSTVAGGKCLRHL